LGPVFLPYLDQLQLQPVAKKGNLSKTGLQLLTTAFFQLQPVATGATDCEDSRGSEMLKIVQGW
jgi:hypothetical protein